MNLARHRERLARLDQLNRLAAPSPAESAERDRLQAIIDGQWRDLPRRIDRKRHDLTQLLAFADELGLGPC